MFDNSCVYFLYMYWNQLWTHLNISYNNVLGFALVLLVTPDSTGPPKQREGEGGRDQGKEGGRDRGRDRGREGGRDRGREGGREGGGREGGREGGRDRGTVGGRAGWIEGGRENGKDRGRVGGIEDLTRFNKI